jgi:hypothetical protein
MMCPVCSRDMVRISEGAHQCAFCASGPNSLGSYPFSALSCVERGDGEVSAVAVEYRGGTYFASRVRWIEVGGRRFGEMFVEDSVQLEDEDEQELELPVVIRCDRPWELQPGVALQDVFFEGMGRRYLSR